MRSLLFKVNRLDFALSTSTPLLCACAVRFHPSSIEYWWCRTMIRVHGVGYMKDRKSQQLSQSMSLWLGGDRGGGGARKVT